MQNPQSCLSRATKTSSLKNLRQAKMAEVLADYAEVCCAGHSGKAEVQLSKLIREKVHFDR